MEIVSREAGKVRREVDCIGKVMHTEKIDL